jgi:hypothetical protein
MRYVVWFLIAGLCLSACSDQDAGRDPRTQAKEVADLYLEKIQGPNRLKRVSVEDEGTRWRVTYHLPEGWAGGDNIIWVDKRTMTVVDSLSWQ